MWTKSYYNAFVFVIVRKRESWLAAGLGVRRPGRKTRNEFLCGDSAAKNTFASRTRGSWCKRRCRVHRSAGSPAGMHLVALLPPGVNDRTVSRRAAEAGISAIPLSSCYLKRPSRGGLVLGYGGTSKEQIEDGIRKLAKILRDVV
jgi:hypothetical protein